MNAIELSPAAAAILLGSLELVIDHVGMHEIFGDLFYEIEQELGEDGVEELTEEVYDLKQKLKKIADGDRPQPKAK